MSEYGPFDADELVRWVESYGHPETWAKRAQALHGQNEIMRAAFQRILDHGETHDEPCWALHQGDCAEVFQEIARSALKGEGNVTGFTTYIGYRIFFGDNWCARCSACGVALTKFCFTRQDAEREAAEALPKDHRCRRGRS